MVKRTDVGRVLKITHELGSYGLVGGFAVQLLYLSEPLTEAGLQVVGDVARWILTPAVLIVILSGLLAMFVRTTFFTKGWVWLKVLLTVPTFYATLATHPDLSFMGSMRPGSTLGLALVAAIVITVFSVWRPKGLLGLA